MLITYQAASKEGSCEESLKINSFFLVVVEELGILNIKNYFLGLIVGWVVAEGVDISIGAILIVALSVLT